ncbi:MAG: hypothetical protein WDZ93_02270 [Candidatus Paceibacterota bacterium]
MRLPKTLTVVPDGHNRITLSIRPTDDPNRFACGFKSTRGVELDGPSVMPTYWYHCFPGQELVDFLMRFNYEPDDQLILGEGDFRRIESVISGPIFDLSTCDVRVGKTRKRIGIFVHEPEKDFREWSVCTHTRGYWSWGTDDSAEGAARRLRSRDAELPIFMSESVFDTMKEACMLPALPVEVVHDPDMPEVVYNPHRPSFLESLGWFLRWRAVS